MPIRYVNTASTAGGDGTTNATSGVNRAYASLSEAVSAIPADITGLGPWIIECSGSAADTTAVNVSGKTTTSSDYILIRQSPSDRHRGVWSATKYRLVANAGANALAYSALYVKVDGLQIHKNNTDNYRWGISVELPNAVGETTIQNCLIRGSGVTHTGSQAGVAFNGTVNSGQRGYFYNNIVYDFPFSDTGLYGGGVYQITGGFDDIANNTFVNCGTAIDYRWGVANSARVRNNVCAAIGTGRPMVGTFSSGSDYNATDQSTMWYTVTGSGNVHDRVSQVFAFKDAANGDYHLRDCDTGARGWGATLYPDITDDIDGESRLFGRWDIGADQFIPDPPPLVRLGGTSRVQRKTGTRPTDFAINYNSPQARGLVAFFGGRPDGQWVIPGTAGRGYGVLGRYYSINSSNDLIYRPTIGSFANGVTLCAWCKTPAVMLGNKVAVAWQSAVDANDGVQIVSAYGDVQYLHPGANSFSLTTATASTVYHFAGTSKTGATAYGYVNGKQVASYTLNPISGTPGVAAAGFGGLISQGKLWNGELYEVRIYDRMLSASEIAALYDPATRWDLYWQPKPMVSVPNRLNPSDRVAVRAAPAIVTGRKTVSAVEPPANGEINWASPLTKDLVFAHHWQSPSDTIIGTVVRTVPQFGPVRGFYTTDGTGSTDKITTTFMRANVKRTWAFWVYYRNSGGGGNGALLARAASGSELVRAWSVSVPFNNTSGAFTYTMATGWRHLVVVLDCSDAPTMLPVIYVDGAPVSVSVTTQPVGTYNGATDTGYVIGNTQSGSNAFGGMVGPVLGWDRLLTADEVKTLYRPSTCWSIYAPQRTPTAMIIVPSNYVGVSLRGTKGWGA